MKADQENYVRDFFESESPAFLAACKNAGIAPTKRQASKYLNKKGAAYKAAHTR